jgi:hypothetical protein
VLVVEEVAEATAEVSVGINVDVVAVKVKGSCALVEEIEEGFCNPGDDAPLDATFVNNKFELPGLVLETEVLLAIYKLLPPNPSELI